MALRSFTGGAGTGTVILQIFGIVLFPVILVVIGVTEIKKTPMMCDDLVCRVM